MHMEALKPAGPTPVPGITYYTAFDDWVLTGLDARVAIPLGGLPVPLLTEDYDCIEGEHPSYDAVGRGIYQTLRANPDCAYKERYAHILQEGYPHFISEMATHIVMLDKKDVDLAYLDRQINYLKIFFLLDPANHHFPLSIGKIYLDKGLSLAGLGMTTMNMYRAEEFLRKAHSLCPGDVTVGHQLGEVAYILGKYEAAVGSWRSILSQLDEDRARDLEHRLVQIEAGVVPKVPAVDYLQAIGTAFSLHQQGEYEECAAILLDVMDDAVFAEQFPLPEVSYILGVCCVQLGMPRHAEEYFHAALKTNPDCTEALAALHDITG